MSLTLLLKVDLYTSLARLPLIVLVCVFCLSLSITCETSHCTTNGTRYTITHPFAEIVQLTLRFLLLSCAILITSLLLEPFTAN